MQINDGTGGGHSAKVTGDGRVAVNADDGCLAAAKAGLLYSMSMATGSEQSLTITSNGGIIMYLSNSSKAKKSLVIDSILVASGAAGMICSVVTGMTEGSIANADPIDAFSTNTGYPIGHSAGYSAGVWDEVSDGITGFTNGVYAISTLLPAGGPVELVPSGRFIVAPGGNIAVFAKNAGEFTSAIRFYEIDEHKGY